MTKPIVSTDNPITLIGGAQVSGGRLGAVLRHAGEVVAADGGANIVLANGLNPLAVIGDMDSISDTARAAFADVYHPIPEQDSTDLEKCLSRIAAPMILGIGFTGDRIDHTLAAFHVLLRYRAVPVILIGEEDICVICPAHLCLTLPVGMRVSLMPIAPARVSTKGLRWEVTDGAMSMGDFMGSSNEAAKEQVEIYAIGGLAVILPPEALGALLAALKAAVREGQYRAPRQS